MFLGGVFWRVPAEMSLPGQASGRKEGGDLTSVKKAALGRARPRTPFYTPDSPLSPAEHRFAGTPAGRRWDASLPAFRVVL